MQFPNFTLIDIRGVALASLLFLVFGFAPGYAIGWLSNVFSFRRRLIPTRLLLATTFSISVSPVVCYWIGWLAGAWGVWIAYAIAAAATAFLLVRDVGAIRGDLRGGLPFVLIVGLWVVVAIASVVDIQIGDRLYFSPLAHDYSVHAAITDAISRTGVRPASPFFYPGAPVALRFHHFWFIVCSFVARLGGKYIDARQALMAGSVWAGIGLIAIVPLYLRFVCDRGAESIRRRSLIGIGLVAVTGLDLIPTALIMKFGGALQPDLDLWNTPIFSWAGSVLWASHHVASLIACLTGFLLLWAGGEIAGRAPLAAVVLSGCCFAAGVGSSIYVALVFAVFLSMWSVLALARGWRKHAVCVLAAGLLAAAFASPHLISLIQQTSRGGLGGGLFLEPWVRTFRFAEILMDANRVSPKLEAAVQMLLLPLNYFLEFGFFFAVGVLAVKRQWFSGKRTTAQLAILTLFILSLFMSTFLRSSVISFNDLGMRGILFTQFVLLLWAVEYWPQLWNSDTNVRMTLAAFLVLGAAGTVYQITMLRIFPLLADRGSVVMPGWLSPDRQLGLRTMALRKAYYTLERELPRNAIVQSNPDTDQEDFFYGLYADRQTAAASRSCDTPFGGSAEVCKALVSGLAPLFENSAASQLDRRLRISALVVRDTDPVWSDRNSWIWHAPTLFTNGFVRVIATANATTN